MHTILFFKLVEEQLKILIFLYVAHDKCEYNDCIFSLFRRTVEELVPKNVTVSIPQKGICPPEHTVCCEGFQKLNDQCVGK